MSDTKIISTEIVFGKNDQKIIAECHRIRKEVFHLEQAWADSFRSINPDFLPVAYPFVFRDSRSTPNTTSSRSSKNNYDLSSEHPSKTHSPATKPLAVDKDYRKHRFGRLLVESLHKWIAEDAKMTHRPAEVEAHSQIPAMGFYAKFGYTIEGAQFDEDGEPHQNMVVHLPIPS
ncbi:hypothetical protein C8F04DRAFT_1350969 [Mycena alexandri]|uniref:N-acetyltransferase domain-containing protein n=1 Tax=Mycena alexandri TaxID=1745969 RepID=A0AAD6TGC7_9AGAR|nr:hypothetical protein C8F04DRAFT_1350969 [Mycena alexandri]